VAGGRYLGSLILVIAFWMLVSAPLVVGAAFLLNLALGVLGCGAWRYDPLAGLGPVPGPNTLINRTAELAALVNIGAGAWAAGVARQKSKAAALQPTRVSPGLVLLGTVWGVAVVGVALAAVQMMAFTEPGAQTALALGLLRRLEVGAAAVLFVGLIAGFVAATLRQTAQRDELLGVFGSAAGFLAVNFAVLAVVAVLGWVSSLLHPGAPLVPLAWLVLVASQLAIVGGIALLWCGPALTTNLLRRYDLANGLLNEHPIRQFLIRLFDREYYGNRRMDPVLEAAVEGKDTPFRAVPHPKTFGEYAKKKEPIHVAVVAANAAAVPGSRTTALLTTLPPQTPVVDGLLAAIAVTPFLPPLLLRDQLLLDATNVTNEPSGAALDYLRVHGSPAATAVHVYPVTHLPIARGAMPPVQASDYAELLKVVERARQLERLRDAKLDRRLTQLFTRVIPPTNPRFPAPTPQDPTHVYLRASIFPIEPESPGVVNRDLFQAETGTDRRRLIAETVADGCRAALETMIARQVGSVAGPAASAKCARVIEALFEARYPGKRVPARLPGADSSGDGGPGIAEVCEHCALRRPADPEDPRRLAVRMATHPAAEWPGQGAPVPQIPASQNSSWPTPIREADIVWPLDHAKWRQGKRVADTSRPTVSFLFSGGVFRGVYQLGALNALNEAGLQPDVIAGASVGSITAAMIARVFRERSTAVRQERIARLAAVYLGLDRLVMTDRFADFIRAITVRAAHTGFSIREADRVFRRYDAPWAGVYSREVRRVLAGLERLCYASPFEVKDLVEAARRQQLGTVGMLMRRYVQEWLDRLGVSNQVLGAEPLQLLIEEYVLDGLPPAPSAPANLPRRDVPFDHFLKDGICFLAAVTNLTGGRLEVLGLDQLFLNKQPVLLLQSLLASSAFPGVFRPRWSWEFLPGSGAMDRYIDGGVTDNLPLDAVTEFLHNAAAAGIVTRRPTRIVGDKTVGTPHLLLATSLEPRLESLSTEELRRERREAKNAPPAQQLSAQRLAQIERLLPWRRQQLLDMEDNWPKLYRRAKRLQYNLKLDVYAEAQRALRYIMDHGGGGNGFTPVDLEVVAVKPEWLCGTFAFHPMMGFRRKRQAQIIAHGCFTTLLRLGRIFHGPESQPIWGAAWGLKPGLLPGPAVLTPPVLRGYERPKPLPTVMSTGDCCIRPGITCPFSSVGTAGLAGLQMPHTVRQLNGIYKLCCQAETHHGEGA